MNRSNTLRWTRIRDRAQQSWPALSNTAYGAVAAARSRSASANTMLALLPPSSRVTRFTWRGAAGHDLPADLGGPGEDDLAHRRVVDQALADHRALARQHLEHALGQPGLQGQLADPDRGQRGPLGRLGDHRVARGQRRAPGPSPGSASGSSTARSARPRRRGSLNVTSSPPGTGICWPNSRSGAAE